MRSAKGHASGSSSHDSPGWLTTFNDLVTLLMVFFVLLFTMGSIDTQKMKDFQHALQSGLGVLEAGNQTSVAVQDSRPVSDMSRIGMQPEGRQAAQTQGLQHEVLEQVQQMVRPDLGLTVWESKQGVHLTFTDSLLFALGSAEIRSQGLPLLQEIAQVIRRIPYQVRVAGHTDNVPIHTRRFPSNWELSIARAVNVVKHLIDIHRIDPGRLSAVGYGDSKPLVANDSPAQRAKNRRVEFVLITEGQQEHVK